MDTGKTKTEELEQASPVKYWPLGFVRYPLPEGEVHAQIDVRLSEHRTDRLARQARKTPSRDVCDEVLDALQKDHKLRKLLEQVQKDIFERRRSESDGAPETMGAQEILDRLPEAEGKELLVLVCEAAMVRFSEDQRERLLPILWDFIVSHRDSTSQTELAPAGAAIRKYVAMMDAASIGSLAVLVEPGHHTSLSLDLEMAVSEMVYEKFSANPPGQPEPEPALALQLAQMSRAYLHPRLVYKVEEGYAGVAMLSAQALAVMLSEQWVSIIDLLRESPQWFRLQLRRRLCRAVNRWRELSSPSADELMHLVDTIDTN